MAKIMKLPRAYRTGTNVAGSLGRDTGPTFAQAKIIDAKSKGFLGTGIRAEDFGAMAGAAMYITDLQGKRQSQQASIKLAEAEQILAKYEAQERIEIKNLPEDVVTDAMREKGYALSAEVMPALYKKFNDEAIPQAAELIDTAGFRGEWTAGQQLTAANKQSAVIARSTKRLEGQILADQEIDYKKAMDQEQYGIAEGIIDGMQLSDSAKSAMKADVASASERTSLNGILASGDIGLIGETIDAINSEDYNGTMNSQTRLAAVNSLARAAVQAGADRKAQISGQRAEKWRTVQKGIMDQSYTEADLETDYQAFVDNPNNPQSVNPKQYIQALKALRVGSREKLKATGQIAMVEDIMNGTAYADPTAKVTKDAVNSYVRQKGLENLPELENLMIGTGVMPDLLVQKFNTVALQQSAKDAEPVIDLYSRLETASPHLLTGITGTTDSLLSHASSLYSEGMPAAEAMTIAREAVNVAPSLADYRKKELTKYRQDDKGRAEKKDLVSLMSADDDFSRGPLAMFGSSVQPAEAELVAFGDNVETFFMGHGNIELAQKQAYNQFKRNNATSETGAALSGADVSTKNAVMRYSPEQVLNKSSDELNSYLRQFALANDLEPDNVFVLSDDTTARDLNSWSVKVIDPDTGDITALLDTDSMRPARWFPTEWAPAVEREKAYEEELNRIEGLQETSGDRLKQTGSNAVSTIGAINGAAIDIIAEPMIELVENIQIYLKTNIKSTNPETDAYIQQSKREHKAIGDAISNYFKEYPKSMNPETDAYIRQSEREHKAIGEAFKGGWESIKSFFSMPEPRPYGWTNPKKGEE